MTQLLLMLLAAMGAGRENASDSLDQAPDRVLINEERIQPWTEDPRYWQYKGRPVLLLGGSKIALPQINLGQQQPGLDMVGV